MPDNSLRNRALEKIRSGDEVLQRDLGDELGIRSSLCSKILIQLEKEGVIKREWIKVGKSRVYKITPVEEERVQRGFSREVFNALFSGNEISVCIGCSKECDPIYCSSLNAWIRKLPECDYHPAIQPPSQ